MSQTCHCQKSILPGVSGAHSIAQLMREHRQPKSGWAPPQFPPTNKMVLCYVWYKGRNICFLVSSPSLTSWVDCLHWLYFRLDAGPCVNHKNGAVHKGFKSESEAYIWFQTALLKGNIELINWRVIYIIPHLSHTSAVFPGSCRSCTQLLWTRYAFILWARSTTNPERMSEWFWERI